MPKMKSHSSAKKRFKITGKNKVRRKKAGMRHLLSKQSSAKKLSLKKPTFIVGKRRKKVMRMLST